MIDDLKTLKKLYEDGENIISYLKKKYDGEYSLSDLVSISYDIQAGSYIKKAQANPSYESERGQAFANVLNQLGDFNSILESGIGEGTSHASIAPLLQNKNYKLLGFDISYSRIKYARQFLRDNDTIMPYELFLGDYLHCPLSDDSVEIVYTVHALEPSGGMEKNILSELYRVAGKYLVLFEPSYELGSNAARNYISKHGYVKNLFQSAKDLNLNIIEYKILFDGNDKTPNNTAVLVIEKDQKFSIDTQAPTKYSCPITKSPLNDFGDCFYSERSFFLYPVIKSIPCLLKKNAIVASHFLE